MAASHGPFIEQVALLNYKSIASCDVALRPLTVITGRNGSGKSNFLDGLNFVADALQTSLEQAIRLRGGIEAISNRLGGPRLGIEIYFRLADDRRGTYRLELDRGLVREEALIITTTAGVPEADFLRTPRMVTGRASGKPMTTLPSVFRDRLALVTLSGLPEFRDAFDALSSMRFYRFNPQAIREPQDPGEGTALREDGSNVASIWRRLHPDVLDRLTQFLNAIVPDVKNVRPVQLGEKELGAKETLRFDQVGPHTLSFYASSMSDGTLRALGALIASRQDNGVDSMPTLVGIEEPETALHPGAVAVLMDAFHEASAKAQIIITSHSPDLLDHVDIETDALLVTDLQNGVTTIAAVDGASLEAIRSDLYTPGELLRMDQLHPVPAR